MSTNKAVERVFDAAMKSMQDQPIAQDNERMAGLQEYLELLVKRYESDDRVGT